MKVLTVLRGIDVPPVVVGFARGLAEAVVLAALGAAAVYLTDGDNVPDNIEFVLPGAFLVIRTLEGIADHIDPAKQRVP